MLCKNKYHNYYYLDYLPGELQVVNSQSPSCHDIDPELSTCRIGFKLKISGELADEDFKKGYKTVKRVSGSGSLFIDGEGHVKEKFDKLTVGKIKYKDLVIADGSI